MFIKVNIQGEYSSDSFQVWTRLEDISIRSNTYDHYIIFNRDTVTEDEKRYDSKFKSQKIFYIEKSEYERIEALMKKSNKQEAEIDNSKVPNKWKKRDLQLLEGMEI